MSKNILFLINVFFLSINLYSQSTYDREIDFGNQINVVKIFDDKGNYTHLIVESEHMNVNSRNKIYSKGSNWGWDDYQFWTYIDSKKHEIINHYVRYGPWIRWYGENIAEIYIPVGTGMWHSFFYNFRTQKTSKSYPYSMYIDSINERVIVWAEGDIEVYDLNTDRLLRNYHFSDYTGINYFLPYINWEFLVRGRELIFTYDVVLNLENEGLNLRSNKRGTIIYDY